MTDIERNREVLQHWYNNMWGKTDFDLIPSIAAAKYLRHDITGANNLMPSESYRDMLKPVLGHLEVEAFTYYLVCEGDYVGALGRYLLPGDKQWDWVQLFRVQDQRLVETWLAGMGGTDPMGYPHPRNLWTGTEIPTADISDSPNKQLVRAWLNCLAGQESAIAADFLAPQLRAHDLFGADQLVTPQEYFSKLRALMNDQNASDLQCFLIEESSVQENNVHANTVVFATCSWKLGEPGENARQWDWVQAFEISDGKIARTWLPVIGGNDESIQVGPETRWAEDALPEDSTVLEITCPHVN